MPPKSNTVPVIGAPNPALIQVHPRQQGNPLLKLVRHFKWTFVESHVGDYSTGSTGIVYLELGYHRLHPNYATARLHEVGQLYRVRVLLVHVNEQNSDASSIQGVILELNKLCFSLDFTLVLAFSLHEAARYIETYKHCDSRGAASIQEKLPSSSSALTSSSSSSFSSLSASSGATGVGGRAAEKAHRERESAYLPRVNKIFTAVRSVNKSNVATLLDVFQCVGNIFQADAEQLMLCPGLGEKRARRLFAACSEPFNERGRASKRERDKEKDKGNMKTKVDTDGITICSSVTATSNDGLASGIDRTVTSPIPSIFPPLPINDDTTNGVVADHADHAEKEKEKEGGAKAAQLVVPVPVPVPIHVPKPVPAPAGLITASSALRRLGAGTGTGTGTYRAFQK